MQFSLQSLMLSFIVVASAVSAFGPWGIAIAALLLASVACIRSKIPKIYSALCLIIVFLCLAYILFLLSGIHTADQPADHMELTWINYGLIEYKKEHGCYPPAYITGPDGKPWHSWRMLISPYGPGFMMDIYEQYNFDEPWDGPNNNKLSKTLSTSSRAANWPTVIGQGTVLRINESVKLDEITDGADKTILLVEMPYSDIGYLEPRDLNLEDLCRVLENKSDSKSFAWHTYNSTYFYKKLTGTWVVFADGYLRFLKKDFLSKYARALFSQAGGDVVDFSENGPDLNWPLIVAMIILILSMALLIFRPRDWKIQSENLM
jgi:hypothetical protein